MSFWKKFSFPKKDAQVLGSWAFNMLKPPTEDFKKVGAFAYDKFKPPVKDFRTTGGWAFDLLKKTVPKIGEGVGEGITSLAFGDVRKTGIAGIPEHIWELEKEIVRIPGKISFQFGKTGARLVVGEKAEDTGDVLGFGQIDSYNKKMEDKYLELRSQGMSDKTASVITTLGVGGEMLLDATILSGFIRTGMNAIAKNIKIPPSSQTGAWEELGKPKTLKEAQKIRNELQQFYHPDKATGNAVKSAEINNAYDILVRTGIPKKPTKLLIDFKKTVDILEKERKLSSLKKPLDIFKEFKTAEKPYLGTKGLLPEVAGTMPTQPLQARQPAMGLSIRDIKAKPLTSSDKALDVMRKPKVDEFQSRVIAGQDLGKEIGKKVNPDGTLTLYHGTSKQNATDILKSGKFNEGAYFSVKKTGTEFGDSPLDVAKRKFGKDATVMEIKVDARTLESAAAGSEVFSPKGLIKENGIWKAVKEAKPVSKPSPLIQEAKGKTLEEFVKAQGTSVYHGTGEKFDIFKSEMKGSVTGAESAKGAIWFTDNPATAKAYSIYASETGPINKLMKQHEALEKIAQKSGSNSDWAKVDKLTQKIDDLGDYEATYQRRLKNANVKEATIKGDFYTVDAKGKTPQELSSEGDIDSWLNRQLEKARSMKKDGVVFKNLDDAVGLYDKPSTHYAIFDPNNIKTKSQLTDIWKKAQPEAPKKLPTAVKGKEEIKLLTSPDKAGEGFVMKGLPKKEGMSAKTVMKKELKTAEKTRVREKVAVEELKTARKSFKTARKSLSGFDNFVDITKIERKNIPYKEMNMAERIVGDKTYPAIRKSGFYATKEIQTAPVRDTYTKNLAPHLMALKQDGYKQGGKFGTVFSKIWKPTENVIRVEKEFNSKNVKAILDLGKKYKIKATKKNLEHLSDVVEKKVKATPNEELYIVELRKTLDGLREEANVVREAMGKKRMGYIENYIPHIQKANIWSELLSNKATISDNLDFIIPNQTKNPFAYKRMLEEMLEPERNLYTLLDRYIGVIGKDIYYTPAIENIKAYNSVLKGREKIKASQYWDEYIRQGLIGKQHNIDTALGVGQKGRKVSIKWNDMLNKAFLTGKVAWNIATQPLSYIMNVPMETGIKNSVVAIRKSFDKPLRQFVKENSNVLNIKNSDVHAIAVGEGRNIQNRIYRTKIDKYNDFISMLGAIEERELTLASYIAGLDKAKDLGYKGKDALWFADLTSARTQSMYNRENRALILNSDITRTVFPFSSFNIEMYNHAKEILTKSGGAYKLDVRQRVGKLFGLIVGMYLANKYSEFLTGKKKTTVGTFIPFLGGTVVDPYIAKMKGEQFYGGRSPITVIQIGEDIIKGSQDYIKHGSTKRLRKIGVNFGLALGGMGGGGQINNLIDGIMANIDEDVKNVKGETMFEVKDAMSKIKAPIFGVWATKEGIEYWSPKEKTPYEKASSEQAEKNKKEKEAFMPTYNKIVELDKTNKDEARKLLDNISDDEYEIYKSILSSEKSKATIKAKEDFYPTFQKIVELDNSGKKDEARRLLDSLTNDEYEIYLKLLKKFEQ